MHLSSDAKDLLYKCTILTAMTRRLTRVRFLSNFPQMNISGKQNQSQKRCEASDVSNAQTDVSLRHSHVHDPDHTACVTKFTL